MNTDVRSVGNPERIEGDISKVMDMFKEHALSFYNLDSYNNERGYRMQGIAFNPKNHCCRDSIPLEILKQCNAYMASPSFNTIVWTLWFEIK